MRVEVYNVLGNTCITIPEINTGNNVYFLTCIDQRIISFCYNKATREVVSCNEVCTDPWYDMNASANVQSRALARYISVLREMCINHDDHVYASNLLPNLKALRSQLQKSAVSLAS